MRILITGNLGRVGPVLTRYLCGALHSAELIGFDTYFGQSLTGAGLLPEALLDQQVVGEIREFPTQLLYGVDAVVHLSAISNDPMGNKFEAVIGEINRHGTVRIARLAAERRVKSFVFASSCSMYGYAENGARKGSDPTNPLTAYARSKIGSEKGLAELVRKSMPIKSLRFATACGMSDRLRLDLVLNDFVACAIAAGEITLLSDGTPWRRLIDFEDMARAILSAIRRKRENGGEFLAVNADRDESNHHVRDLAEAVGRHVPGTTDSINTNAPRQAFLSSGLRLLPVAGVGLHSAGDAGSVHYASARRAGRHGFRKQGLPRSPYMRLKTLERHMAAGYLGTELRSRFRPHA
jgi:nucleoside-diphosphate-sugar epimerase